MNAGLKDAVTFWGLGIVALALLAFVIFSVVGQWQQGWPNAHRMTDFVRQHPLVSVIAAASVGYCLGRGANREGR